MEAEIGGTSAGGRHEQLDRVARRVFQERAAPASTGRDLAAEPGPPAGNPNMAEPVPVAERQIPASNS